MIRRQLKFNITTKELNIPLKIKKKSLFEKYRKNNCKTLIDIKR